MLNEGPLLNVDRNFYAFIRMRFESMLSRRMAHPLLLKLETAANLSEMDRALIDRLLVDVRSFEADQIIISVGDKPEHVHLMVSGWSCRFGRMADGGRQITAFLLPGDLCDPHVTMLRRMDHSIGAVGACAVAFIQRDTMADLFDRPAIDQALRWAGLVDEGVLRAWIVNMGQRGAIHRLAHLICELHARLQNVGLATETGFNLPLRQTDFADALGLTSVHVNRTLRRLRESGMLNISHGHIEIPDLRSLQRMGSFNRDYLHLTG